MGKSYTKLETLLPGVCIGRFAHSRFVYVRLYDKNTRSYTNRSTGIEDVDQAKAWIFSNLSELFQQKATPKGGGNTSIKRLLSSHLDYQQRRFDAGEIAPSSFESYTTLTKHFFKWFPDNGYFRLIDIKRTSLKEYALNRVNKDGLKPNSANQEVMYIRMWWNWLQSQEILSRPIDVPKLKIRVGSRSSTAPFDKGHLKQILDQVDSFVESKTLISQYNKELFRCFLHLLEQSGCRVHEVIDLTWNDVTVGETVKDEKMIVTTLSVPMDTKRGRRQCVFRGDVLIKLKALHQEYIEEPSKSHFLFRNLESNTVIDRSTFNRYWSTVRKKLGMEQYVFHTFRAHRITQLIMAGVEVELIGRNLGVSPSEIYDTYLRFAPADHYSKLVQKDVEVDPDLNVIFNRLNAPGYHRKMG